MSYNDAKRAKSASTNETVKLIGIRLDAGLALNLSGQRFFGSPRTFERNILRKIKSKEI